MRGNRRRVRRQPRRVLDAFDDEFFTFDPRADRVAAVKSFRDKLPQIAFAGKVLRRMKGRIVQPAEFDFEVALFGDFERILHRFGHFREERFHFVGRAQIKLLRLIAQPLGVIERGLCANADQHVVRVRMALLEVMNVVGGNQFQAELRCPSNQMAINLGLLGQRMVLEFEVKIFGAERLFEPVNCIPGFRQIILLDQIGDFAGQTAGQRDQALLVPSQKFFVDARLIVEPFQMRGRDELDEIFVTHLIFGEQQEMVIHITASAGRFLFPAVARRHIDFAADDWLDAFIAGGLIEINRTVEHSVVGKRERGELQIMGLLHQPVQTAGAIQQRILRMQMEVDKVRMRHETNVMRGREAAQVNSTKQNAVTWPLQESF